MRLESRAAIMAGGAQGILKAIAAAFVSKGARALIAGIAGARADRYRADQGSG